MNSTLLHAIHTALMSNPEAARLELVAMGVSHSAVDRLAGLSASDVPTLAALNVVQISINYEALAGLHSLDELAEIYFKRGATTELLERVLGLTTREIALQRAGLGLTAPLGRTPVIDEVSHTKARELHRTLSHLPLAERLLAIHDRLPMWPLTSIYAAIRP